jgi:hypothetical protein
MKTHHEQDNGAGKFSNLPYHIFPGIAKFQHCNAGKSSDSHLRYPGNFVCLNAS